MHANDLLQEFSETPSDRPTTIKAAGTENNLITPHIVNSPPLINNPLTPDSSMTNNELEINISSAPASPVLPAAEPASASPISINSATGESPVSSGSNLDAAGGLGSPRSTSLSPIDYYSSNAHPQHCSSIPRPRLCRTWSLLCWRPSVPCPTQDNSPRTGTVRCLPRCQHSGNTPVYTNLGPW